MDASCAAARTERVPAGDEGAEAVNAVPLNSVLTVVSSVYREMAHIEPIAANAVAMACAEIGDRLRENVVVEQAPVRTLTELPAPSKGGRRPAEHTVRIDALAVGQAVELTMHGDAKTIEKFRARVGAAMIHLQQRRPGRKFHRRAIDGGYLVARIA